MKLTLLNVVYSPNLGDGLLVECLRWGCKKYLGESTHIKSVDLAGRTAFGNLPQQRASLLRALSVLPSPVRQSVAGAALLLKLQLHLRDFYRRELADADAIVVGGGHLFTDTDLNFPLKLAAALNVAAERSIPTWVYGCGVSDRWSRTAQRLFQDAVRAPRVVDAFVRDDYSRAAWNSQLVESSGISATTVRDPGLLCRQAYGVNDGDVRDASTIGVGVIAPVAIRYHSGSDVPSSALTRWFVTLIERLSAAGKRIRLVTNGSPEDTIYGHLLLAEVRKSVRCVDIDFPEHRHPRELVETVRRLSRFVGFRLHGLICAHSFGLPTYALNWDPKIGSFMDSIGRGRHHYDVRVAAPASVVQSMLQDEPLISGHASEESLSGIEALCASIASCLSELAPSQSRH